MHLGHLGWGWGGGGVGIITFMSNKDPPRTATSWHVLNMSHPQLECQETRLSPSKKMMGMNWRRRRPPGLKTVATHARVEPTPLYTDNYNTSAKKTHDKRNARSNSRAPLSASFLIRRTRLRERPPPDPSGPLPPLSSSSLGQPALWSNTVKCSARGSVEPCGSVSMLPARKV